MAWLGLALLCKVRALLRLAQIQALFGFTKERTEQKRKETKRKEKPFHVICRTLSCTDLHGLLFGQAKSNSNNKGSECNLTLQRAFMKEQQQQQHDDSAEDAFQ